MRNEFGNAGLPLAGPVMNAAGTLGFAPAARTREAWTGLGAFITNPVSWGRRMPAGGERLGRFPGGVVLHTGAPNPGFRAVLRANAARWERAPLPVIVHLLAAAPAEIGAMAQILEETPGVMGLEIGLPPEVQPEEAAAFGRAAAGKLPVILRLPLETAAGLIGAAAGSGAAAVSLAPPRGALPVEEAPPGSARLLGGRVYGPAVFPLALQAVRSLAARTDLPVIGAGGVYEFSHVEAMLAAGAAAVQFDTRFWLPGAGLLPGSGAG